MQYVKGPLLILAGAGNGKTSLLACKIAWLIREYDVNPSQIVALASSVHAARALRARVEEILGRKLRALPILCFIEFGLELIQQRLDALGLQPGFSLYDRSERTATVGRLLRQVQPQAADLAGMVSDQIGIWKRNLTPPASAAESPQTSAAAATKIYRRYEQRLQAANAIDIEDIERKAVRLLTTDPALLTQWRERIRFLLVDEYERTSRGEHELIRLLAADGMALTVAGDDTRAIDDHGRGLSANLDRLPADLPGLRVVKLEQNLRCTGRIADAANRIAAGANGLPDSAPSYGQTAGALLRVLQTRNEQDEAEGIAAALTAHQARSGIDYRNYAILFRHLDQAPAIERALRVLRVPYHLRGGPSFFAQAEVRDLWAYLRILCNPADDDAFLRALNTPRRDIDHATLEQLARFAVARGRPLLECALDGEFTQTLAPEPAQTLLGSVRFLQYLIERAKHADPADLTRELIADLRYADWLRDTCNDAKIAGQRMNNVMRVVNMMQRFSRDQAGCTLPSMMPRLQLHAMLSGDDDNTAPDGVALLTFAAAHGAEFAHVYIVGFEEGLLPATDIEAVGERRLAYLAITRARESVTFTIAEHRRLAGGIGARRASRFLADLRTQDLQWISPQSGSVFAENTLGNSPSYTYIESGRLPRH